MEKEIQRCVTCGGFCTIGGEGETHYYTPIDSHVPLSEIKKLCDIIVNSPPDTTIKGEIESLALLIGHNPIILNSK